MRPLSQGSRVSRGVETDKCVSPALFLMLCESHSQCFPHLVQDTPTASPNFQSSVSLDHCYLSLSENNKVLSSCSSSSESTDTESLWGQEVRGTAIHPGRTGVFSLAQSSVLQQANPVGLQTPSDEDRDNTWTPTQRSSGLLTAGKKTKKIQASQGSGKLKDSRKACPDQVKKKCVNGFIMFCRMNRKHYIR